MDRRIENKHLHGRIVSSEEAAKIIKNGMTIAVSGFTASGYPKLIPKELVRRAQIGENLKINIISGANVGPEIDEEMAIAGVMKRRIPFQMNHLLTERINHYDIDYVEIPLNKMPKMVQRGILGEIDVAIIEAIRITKEGYIVPGSSVDMIPTFLKQAGEVIIELNHAQPIELDGIHDIYGSQLPPNKHAIPLTYTNQRIGEPYIRADMDKIKYIVNSNVPDHEIVFSFEDEVTRKISDNLLNFLEVELLAKRMDALPPIQSGLGNMANGIVRAFESSAFNDIEFYCGVLQEANIELMVKGRVKAGSGAAITPSKRVLELIRKEPELFREIMVLRPIEISNNAEIIDRLGLIALNSAIEVDIYGNANVSHIMGSKVVNGIGGGGAFAQNAYLSIMLLPSETKGGNISTIVPMVTHNDLNEHDIDVIITENGVADLRGKTPIERAYSIINNCASLIYKDDLKQYLNKSIQKVGGHQPHLIEECFSWHLRLKKTGSMKGGTL